MRYVQYFHFAYTTFVHAGFQSVRLKNWIAIPLIVVRSLFKANVFIWGRKHVERVGAANIIWVVQCGAVLWCFLVLNYTCIVLIRYTWDKKKDPWFLTFTPQEFEDFFNLCSCFRIIWIIVNWDPRVCKLGCYYCFVLDMQHAVLGYGWLH